MNRNFRLRQSNDVKRVRRFGRSYAHPLVVLVVLAAQEGTSRFGVIAGRSVGNAVQRNRAKRRIREALRNLMPQVKPGWNVIAISRKPIQQATFIEIKDCLCQLLSKAGLLEVSHGS